MDTVNSVENLEETDRVITDTFTLIISKLSDLLKQNIDSLKLPAILKSALEKIQNLFNVEKTKEDAQRTTETQTSSETSGMGQKNNDQIRIKNRRYEIKRLIAQPKNVKVKRNGVVVRRMVVRRKAIFPGARRRREY